MRLSDFVLVWLSNAKRECDSLGKTGAINKSRGMWVQAQPGSSGWVTPMLCSCPTDTPGELWNGKAASKDNEGRASCWLLTAPSTTLCPPAKFWGFFFLILAWLKANKESEMKHSASLSYYFFASLPVRTPNGAKCAAKHRAMPSIRDVGHYSSAIPIGIWEEHLNTQPRPLHTSGIAWGRLDITQDCRKCKLFWHQGKTCG